MKKVLTTLVSIVSLVSFAQLEFVDIDGFRTFGHRVSILEDIFGTILWKGEYPPSAEDYVQDGLIAQWDGIDNVGYGVHDPSATMLKDLVGNLDITLPANATVGDCYIMLRGSNANSSSNFSFDSTKDHTVEIVFAHGENDGTGGAGYAEWRIGNLVGASWADQYFAYSRYWSGCRAFNTPATWHLSGDQPTGSTRIASASFLVPASGTASIRYNGGYTQNITTGTTKSAAKISIRPKKNQYTFSIRVYNRALTLDEIRWNYSLDAARFSLP